MAHTGIGQLRYKPIFVKRTNTYGETLDLAILAPTQQAYDLVFSDESTFDETFDETFTGGTGELLFTRGNGSKFLAIVSRNPIVKLPKDGITYPLGYCFSDGSFVIMRGSTPAIDMTDLDAGTWYVAVFEFNGFAGIERYNRTDNQITFTL